MPLPVAFYLFPYLIWLLYPFPSSFILFRCPCPCFVPLSGLSCTIYICIWLPFLPYAYYMWLPWFVLFLSLVPLLNPSMAKMSSAGYCHARFLLSAFFSFLFFSDRVRPNLSWWNFLYLVTTTGFVADQLIMWDKNNVCDFVCFVLICLLPAI